MSSNRNDRKSPLGIERKFDKFGDWLGDSWALKKTKPVFDRFPKALVVLTWLIRLFAGAVFIVSGLSKAIDPWGTFYKMTEYLSAMHIPIDALGNSVLVLSFLLFSLEFLVGVSLALGLFRKATPIIAAVFMMIMLPLTLWIAIADPVADCGCFGDFILLSNWATFAKNVVLSLAIVWLIKFNKTLYCLISPYLQWIAAVALAVFIAIVGYIGYWQQPLLDFRPYKVGSKLFADDEPSEYEPEFSFIYEKDGKQESFSIDDVLPDENDGWKFIRREEKAIVKVSPKPNAPDSGDFRIWDEAGDEDLTPYIDPVGKKIILLIPDIASLSMAASWKINLLYDLAREKGMEFFAIAAGKPDDIALWRDLSAGQYPIYTSEDTAIKEVARGNPALIMLDGNTIRWKTALSALNLNDNPSSNQSRGNIDINQNGAAILLDLIGVLVSVLAVLALISALTYRLRKRKK